MSFVTFVAGSFEGGLVDAGWIDLKTLIEVIVSNSMEIEDLCITPPSHYITN